MITFWSLFRYMVIIILNLFWLINALSSPNINPTTDINIRKLSSCLYNWWYIRDISMNIDVQVKLWQHLRIITFLSYVLLLDLTRIWSVSKTHGCCAVTPSLGTHRWRYEFLLLNCSVPHLNIIINFFYCLNLIKNKFIQTSSKHAIS